MGPFAKLAQASYLLGRVLRHICDLTAERTMHQEEGMQLNDRLLTLLKILGSESEINSAIAICSRYDVKRSLLISLFMKPHSALVTLHDPNSARIDPIYLDFAKRLTKPVVEEPSENVAAFLAANIDHQMHPSPLLAHWIYQVATVVGRLNAQIGDDFGRAETLMSRLGFLNRRWLVAGKSGTHS